MTFTAYLRHRITYAITYRLLIPTVRAATWTLPLHVAETIAERLEARERAITPEQYARTYRFRKPKAIGRYTFAEWGVGVDLYDMRGDLAHRARDVIRRRSVRALARAR